MSKLQDSINQIANELNNLSKLNNEQKEALTANESTGICVYTGDDIRQIRLQEELSQVLFAKYLNVSVTTIRRLEQGKCEAKGAMLKLLNILSKNGISALK